MGVLKVPLMSLSFTQNLRPGSYFITGIGTGVGKTVVTGHLSAHLIAQGQRVVTQKWVQTGENSPADGDIGVHDHLSGASYPSSILDERCPYCFSYPASPHLAAKREGVLIDPDRIAFSLRSLQARYETVLIEGAGGPLVPITDDLLTIDLLKSFNLPCIVVVANRLGAIHDSLTTIESIRSRGVDIAGLIFNQFSDTPGEISEDNRYVICRISGVESLGTLELE